MIGLGIDAGGSSTRWTLVDERGREHGSGKTRAISGHIFTPADLAETSSRILDLLDDVLRVGRPSAAVAGITGFHPDSPAAAELVRTVCHRLGLERSHVLLANDMHIAFASSFDPGGGILIYAGTGSIGYHLSTGGEVLRSGGYGYLIDDAGGGFWIGREGLRETLRWAEEGVEPEPALARAIYADLGSRNWEEIVEVVYGAGRSRVAALAPAVASAAGEGDEAALEILRRAGAELARLNAVLARRLGKDLPVAFAGGIANLSETLTESLRRALPSATTFIVPQTEPSARAARLAIEIATGHARR